MASTEDTTKVEAKAEATDNEKQSEPKAEVRKYFLPETGEVVEATSAREAAALSSKAKQGNKG